MDERAVRHHLRQLGIGPLVRNREWVNGPCPMAPFTRAHKNVHDAKVGFGVHVETSGQSRAHCFTCGYSGTIYDLAAELGRLRGEDYSHISRQAFRDDLVSLSHYDDVDDDPDQLQDPLDPAAYSDLFDPAWAAPAARAYLQERGIGARTARLLGIGWDGDDERVTFPVKDNNGNLYGFSGRTIHGDDQITNEYPKVKDYYGLPKRHLLLGEEHVNPDLPNVVVEGLIGYARFYEEGINEVANPLATLGAKLTEMKAERLMRWNLPTYLLPDLDAAGDVFLWGVIDKKTGEHKGHGAVDLLKDELPLFIPDYPEGVDDVDNFTREHVEHMIANTPLY